MTCFWVLAPGFRREGSEVVVKGVERTQKHVIIDNGGSMVNDKTPYREMDCSVHPGRRSSYRPRHTLAWTHRTRRVEARKPPSTSWNVVADTHIVEALNELRTPKRSVRRTEATSSRQELSLEQLIILNRLKQLIILQSLETTALLDSGCTGSTIHHRFVKEHNLPTRRLPRPSLSITLMEPLMLMCHHRNVQINMTIQDHVEEINFAVSDIGSSDVYIGHDWLKRHNPQSIGASHGFSWINVHTLQVHFWY